MLQEELLEYLAFLVSCAGNLRNEPSTYGSLRLIDAAQRMIELAHRNKLLQNPDLDEIALEIEGGKFSIMHDAGEFHTMLDNVAKKLANIVKNQT